MRLNNDTIKESGKLLIDTAKIIAAVGVITPFIKDGEEFDFIYLTAAVIFALSGLLLFNLGGENEPRSNK